MSETFELWLEENYPESDLRRVYHSGFDQDDLERAWNAGFDAGHAEATNYLAAGGSFK